MSNYHEEVLDQAKKSFRWALIAAAVSLAFLLGAIGVLLFRQATEIAFISGIGGALIEFISAINFYMYGKTTSQMADYQSRLERTQRYLLANSMSESLDEEHKHKVRSWLIRTVAGAVPEHTSKVGSSSVTSDNSQVQEDRKE